MVEAIFKHMDERGIRYSWLAKQLGISTSRLTRIKKGERPIPEDFIRDAFKALGIAGLGETSINPDGRKPE